jgi:hypothetical protein
VTSPYLGEDLIFVISQPRSGSTLLQRILAGHPEIQTSAETWLMLHPAYGLRRRGIQTEYGANWAATGVSEFLEYYADGRQTYDNAVRAFAREIYGTVLAKKGKRYFVDKTPRYTLIVPDLYRLFPEAKFILLFRNPLAVLASELNTYIKGDWPKMADFVPDLLDAPHRLIEARDFLGEKAIVLRYEDLVAAPMEEMQRVCSNLGLTFYPKMLDYSKTPAPKGVMNDPVGVHRHKSPTAARIDKWVQIGTDPQTRHFALAYLDALGAATLEQLGYPATQLVEKISGVPETVRRRVIFPWDLAIRPRRKWRLGESIRGEYFLSAQQKGHARATLDAISLLISRARQASRAPQRKPLTDQSSAQGGLRGSPGSVKEQNR